MLSHRCASEQRRDCGEPARTRLATESCGPRKRIGFDSLSPKCVSQLGLALVRYWWGPRSTRYLVVDWVRETARWPNGIEATGRDGVRWVPLEDVLDAGWLGTG